MTEDSGQRTHRAFIGSFTSEGGRGISTTDVDGDTGALEPRHHTESAVPEPSYLALHGGLLYAVSETDSGAAAVFSPDAASGRPELLGAPVPVRGAGPAHLTLAGGRLFTANFVSGTVSSLPVRADGSLGGQLATHQHHGGGPGERQDEPHAHAVVPDPSGRWLLSADMGTDSIWIYDLTTEPQLDGPQQTTLERESAGAAGELPLHREVRLGAGSGPRHLVFHPQGDRAYILNELNSTVTTCRWDAAHGTLERLGETRTLPAEVSGADNYPSGIEVSDDGRFVWAANRGHDSIALLTLPDGDGGAVEAERNEPLPEFAGTVPCGGEWPRAIALHPSGRWLYVANQHSGDVTWFRLDPATGTPQHAGSVAFPAAACVVFEDITPGSA